MKRGFLIVLCILALPVMASHIVGGEFEIVHIAGNSYRVNLILYFDKLNGSPGAKDINIVAAIYRKRDNQFMQNVSFSNPSETNVSYTQPECSRGEIVTSKLVYTTTVTLSDSRYNDPQGYYIAGRGAAGIMTLPIFIVKIRILAVRQQVRPFILNFLP